ELFNPPTVSSLGIFNDDDDGTSSTETTEDLSGEALPLQEIISSIPPPVAPPNTPKKREVKEPKTKQTLPFPLQLTALAPLPEVNSDEFTDCIVTTSVCIKRSDLVKISNG